MITYKTRCKNLRELNARYHREGDEGILYTGFYLDGQRAYMEIYERRSDGYLVTCGDYFTIQYDADDENFFED